MSKFRKRDETSGVYRITNRDTLPPPTRIIIPKGKLIGSKIPPPAKNASGVAKMPTPPKEVTLPVEEEKPVKTGTPEAEKLKKKLGYERDPEENTTGISYGAFIAGIKDAKKMDGIKDATGNAVMVFILQTEYGEYVLSRKPLGRIKDLHARFVNLDCETNRKMKVPIHEIKDKKEYFYFEKMESRLELDIDVDYSEVGFELTKTLLVNTDLPEIERIIKCMEKQRNTLVNTEIKDIEVIEDPLFDLVYLAVKTELDDEYWIFIKKDKIMDVEFIIPEMSDMVEVETSERVYGAVNFFKPETDRISNIPEN